MSSNRKSDEVLSAITPTLNAVARKFASDEIPQEEVFQNMILGILEKADRSPEFLEVKAGYTEEQRNRYVVNYAAWIARAGICKQNVYHRYVGNLGDILVNPDPDDNDDDDPTENISGDSINPEAALVQNEKAARIMDALKDLGPENQTIVMMTFRGYSNKEVAATLKISPAAVSQRRKQIREKFIGGLGRAFQQQFAAALA